MKLIYFLLIFISLLSLPCFGEVVENFSKGFIDWEKGIINAEGWGFPKVGMHPGQARLLAERAAICDAYRNLVEIINGVRVDSESIVKDSVVSSDVIKTKVQGFVRGAKISKPKYMSDGTIKVMVKVPLCGVGGLNQIFIPKPIKEKEVKEEYIPKSEVPVIDLRKPYTGLIIDAKGKKLRPAMNPKILDEDGREIYGTSSVSREFAVKFGMVGYAKDLEKAKKNDRVKGNPLILKALRTSGKQNTDIVLKNSDAVTIHKLKSHLNFLKECRVIFVVD
jgi:hypothetical protein